MQLGLPDHYKINGQESNDGILNMIKCLKLKMRPIQVVFLVLK